MMRTTAILITMMFLAPPVFGDTSAGTCGLKRDADPPALFGCHTCVDRPYRGRIALQITQPSGNSAGPCSCSKSRPVVWFALPRLQRDMKRFSSRLALSVAMNIPVFHSDSFRQGAVLPHNQRVSDLFLQECSLVC